MRELDSDQLDEIAKAYQYMSEKIAALLDRRIQLPEDQAAEMDSSQSLLYSLSSLTTDLIESDFGKLKYAAHNKPSMTARHLFELVVLGPKARLAVDYVLDCAEEKRNDLIDAAGKLAAEFNLQDAKTHEAEQRETLEALRRSFRHPAAPAPAAAAAAPPPPPPPRPARHAARLAVIPPGSAADGHMDKDDGEYRPGRSKGLYELWLL